MRGIGTSITPCAVAKVMKDIRRMVFSCLILAFGIALAIYLGYIIFSYAKFVFGLPWWLGLILIGSYLLLAWNYKWQKRKQKESEED